MKNENIKYNTLQQAVFTFLYTENEVDWFPCKMQINDRWLHYTPKTEIIKAEKSNLRVIIIGFCCDSHGEIKQNDIPLKILDQLPLGIEQTYRFCDRFAGQYVVICYDGKNEAIWGDSICSIQLNYSTRKVCIGSVDKLVADAIGEQVSPTSLQIRKGSDYEQALPGDITMYDAIKALLPNHYLLVNENNAVRVNMNVMVHNDDIDDILSRSALLVDNITKCFIEKYELICPLTSGYDSRVVYSFLSKHCQDIECFTFMHKNFTDKTADIKIPQQICDDNNDKHHIVNDQLAPEKFYQAAINCIGDYHSKHTLDLAYTYQNNFKDKVMVNGHLIDQIGKAAIGNNVPTWLSNADYFVCKIHNHSKLSKRIITQYLKDAGMDSSNIFDLFAIENRCGRWAAQGIMIYAMCGITSLNIFNCKEVIKLWMQIPRKHRVEKVIHWYYLRNNNSNLLQYPFNPDNNYNKIKTNWPLFYLATFVKHWLG